MDTKEKEAAWGYSEKGEKRWPAALAMLIAVGLYISLPNKFLTGPTWILPFVVILLLITLLSTSWRRHALETYWQRVLSVLLIAVINLYNLFSLGILIYILLHPNGRTGIGPDVLLAAVEIDLSHLVSKEESTQ